MFVTSPDWFRETFREPAVSHGTNANDEMVLTDFEYAYDPDPTDTTIETLYFYLIRDKDGLRVERDIHTQGLFPEATWLRLLEASGFRVEKKPYPVHEDGREAWLLVGTAR